MPEPVSSREAITGEGAEGPSGTAKENAAIVERKRGYRMEKNMDFGSALKEVKSGKRASRAGWNGKKQYIELAACVSYRNAAGEIVNVNHDAIGKNAIAFVGTSGVQIGWLAPQADMLAEDWQIVK